MWTLGNDWARSNGLGLRGVLATIIQVEGSTYQKEGTKCFITEDGELYGILSGGCVESDIKEHAKELGDTRRSKLIRYDFRGDEDGLWGLGVGCNGAITIFLELYDPVQDPERAECIKLSLTRPFDETRTMVTLIDGPDPALIGEKWMAQDTTAGRKSAIPTIIKEKVEAALSWQRKGLYRLEESGSAWTFFLDPITPVPKLLVFGAGPDAVPVVQGAKGLGWHVTVADHRPGYLNQSAFQCADQLVHTPAGRHPEIEIDRNTYIVVMSHHFQQDQLMLACSLSSEAPYIGILGPRHRTQRLLETLPVPYSGWTEEKLRRIHSPIGLDLGSKTPEEIALSILAELTACYRGGNLHSLKEKAGEIRVGGRNPEKECVSASSA